LKITSTNDYATSADNYPLPQKFFQYFGTVDKDTVIQIELRKDLTKIHCWGILGSMEYITSKAFISKDQKYRYYLYRQWDPTLIRQTAVFVGLNPSTADANQDDPTIRRCVSFAKDWGYGSLAMVNLFAYRATDPSKLKTVDDPIGPENDMVIKWAAGYPFVLAAWGSHGTLLKRDKKVMALLSDGLVHCLGVTKKGQPKHPLYLARDTKPSIYRGSIVA